MVIDRLRPRALPLLARATPRPPRRNSDRMLIIQPDHLGDIILSEPAVRYLRERRPDSELVAIVGPWSAEIARMAWPVDQVVEVAFPGFTRRPERAKLHDPYALLKDEIRRLRALDASDALVLRDDAWWAAWLGYGAVSGDVATSADPQARAFATIAAPRRGPMHRTAEAMSIVHSFLSEDSEADLKRDWDMSPRLRDDWSEQRSMGRGDAIHTNQRPYIVIHPGTGAPVKSWPVRSWRALIGALRGTPVTLTGTDAERDLCEEIAAGLDNAAVVAGETSLPELAYLLKEAAAAIGTDNGPMHLAGALGTPTVRIFGPSNPDRYGPWPGTPGQVVVTAGWSCPRCEDLSIIRSPGCGCMAAIAPDQVIRALDEVVSDVA